MVIADGDFAEKVVAVVLPVNAAMVVTLQYSVGRRLNPANIRALMTAGTLFRHRSGRFYFFRQQPAIVGYVSCGIYCR